MHIPSYDELTPSIPDVSHSDVFAAAERVLPASGVVASRSQAAVADGASALFACLRARRSPEAAMVVARDFSPRVERHGQGCVVLDISGLGRLLGDADAIGRELDREATIRGGITVAIAPTQAAALLLSLARPGLSVARSDPAGAVAGVPLAVLQQLVELEGAVTPATAHTFDVLQRWGLKTVGEFAALPAMSLSQRVGQGGIALQRLACGLDARPLVPDPGVPRFVQRMDLEWPIEGLEPLSFVLARLLDPLSSTLERADRGAAAVRLDLRLVDRSTHVRLLQLPAAMRDARVLRTLLLLDLESHPPSAAIDVVTIEIDPAPARIIQYSLLERAMPSAETLATLMARLSALVGEARCGSPALTDTHRPDAFELRPFAPAVSRANGGQVAWDRSADANSVPLRRYRPPVPVRVRVERGRPVRLAIERRGMPGGAVETWAGPWRTSGAWWDTTGTYWDRDEWDLGLADGSLCRVFRDRSSDVWFLEGIFD